MMPEITIRAETYDLEYAMREMRRGLFPVWEHLVERVSQDLIQNAYDEVPVRTGRLQRSIGGERTGELEWKVYAKAPYALYVHEGTRYMEPNPFLMRAVQITARRMSGFVTDAIQELATMNRGRMFRHEI